jgi:hypothetical protein
MPTFLIEVVAILVAMSAGFGVLFLIFVAPAWFYGKEILMLWGWFSWIPGLPIGYMTGIFVRKVIRMIFLLSTESEPEDMSRAWQFLIGIGLVAFGSLIYTGDITDIWLVGIPLLSGLFLIARAWTGSNWLRKD